MISQYIEKIVSTNNISDKLRDRLAYSVDATQLEGKTDQVIWPTSVEQINQIILYCRRNRKDLVVRGAGTSFVAGATPKDSIVLDISKMNNIIQASKLRLFVDVEAGVILKDLNNSLRKANLKFPIVPFNQNCTIGGLISTNASGKDSLRYGEVSNWVSELEIVDGSGKLIIVKGSKIKEFCGSEGTLGIITKAKLKLTELEKVKSMNFYSYNDPSELIHKAAKLKSDEDLLSLEFISKTTLEIIKFEDATHILLAEFENEQGQITDENQIKELQKLRSNIYNYLAYRGYSIVEAPKIPAENLPKFIDWLTSNRMPSYGHIGQKIIHVSFKNREKIQQFYDMVKKLNGIIPGEFGIGAIKKEFASEEFKDKITKLKAQYDPDNILNRGVII